jgi:predicted aminopeptidase
MPHVPKSKAAPPRSAPRSRPSRHAALALALVAALLLGGCSSGTLGYVAAQAQGHLALMAAARPVDDWLADAATADELRTRLELAQRIRRFAVDALKLPDNRSYTRYADLKRPAVLWNVVAAPELSLRPKTWCFPVAGCISYRGYFDRAAADALAAELRAAGWEVVVNPVPAYSTLGWFADPLLNTFIGWPEGELARIVFHELAHQVAYAADDSAFNESFATAVEQLGVERWLEQASAGARAEYAALDARRRDIRALLLAAHRELEAIYEQAAAGDADKRVAKQARLALLRRQYEQLRDDPARPHWRGADGRPFRGYDRLFDPAPNNAQLAGYATYHAQVPALRALFEAEGRDFDRYYRRVQQLARAPRAERDAALAALVRTQGGGGAAGAARAPME